jgi:hypothetical protein
MADSIAEQMAPLTHLWAACPPARKAGPEVLTIISSLLVKRILELQETLEFYEMHFLQTKASNGDAPLQSGPV